MLQLLKNRTFAERVVVSRGNQDNRREVRAWNSGNKDGSRTGKKEYYKALVTIDGEGVDWTSHSEEDKDYALMACNNSESDTEAYTQGLKKVEAQLVAHHTSTEPSELVSEPVVNESNVECQLKVWSDALIIEEYESDSEDEYMSISTKEQETPSFANQQTKTSRETVKNQFTHSKNPKVDKKELGYGFTARACFVCGSLNHLIRDCDFHEKRMAKQAVLNNRLNMNSSQREIRPIWNNVQRVNKQNQFVPTAVLTRTSKIPVNTARASGTKNVSTARHSFNRQAVLTSTAMKVNTVKPNVNRVKPVNVFNKTHSPFLRPFNNTTAPRTIFSRQKVNTAKATWTGKTRPYLLRFQDFNGGLIAFGGSKGYITGLKWQTLHKLGNLLMYVSLFPHQGFTLFILSSDSWRDPNSAGQTRSKVNKKFWRSPIFALLERRLLEQSGFIEIKKDVQRFQMSSMGEITFFLGLQVKQKRKKAVWDSDKSVCACSRVSGHSKLSIKCCQEIHTGGCPFSWHGIISWQCKKQTIVATYTIEAEYVAAASCSPVKPQSNPSPRPSPSTTIPDSIPESSGGNHRGHFIPVSDQAKEIQKLKAHIKKLKKQAKPGRKSAKGEPSVHKDKLFDEIPEDSLDYIETKDAQDVGRTRDVVDEEKENAEDVLSTEDVLITTQQKVSTDKEKVSTDRNSDMKKGPRKYKKNRKEKAERNRLAEERSYQ
ncbi:hypothetical protein Tco_0579340 [Tanacetum coccineum]